LIDFANAYNSKAAIFTVNQPNELFGHWTKQFDDWRGKNLSWIGELAPVSIEMVLL
jgi:hypothetical protein